MTTQARGALLPGVDAGWAGGGGGTGRIGLGCRGWLHISKHHFLDFCQQTVVTRT
jgi:hypothetical protein